MDSGAGGGPRHQRERQIAGLRRLGIHRRATHSTVPPRKISPSGTASAAAKRAKFAFFHIEGKNISRKE